MDGQERTRWLQQQEQRYVWDPLDRYLGPTGVPDRLRGLVSLAGEVAPSTAIMRSMQGAGRAADSGLPADERARAGLESLVEAGTVVVPSAIAARAANLSRASRGMRPSSSAAAQGLDEAVLGVGAVRDAQQEIFDQGRRDFLRGAGAAVLASRLPSEDLMADVGRYLGDVARPASRLPELASTLSKKLAAERKATDRLANRSGGLDSWVADRAVLNSAPEDILSDLLRAGPTTPEEVAKLSDDEIRVLQAALRRHSQRTREDFVDEMLYNLSEEGYYANNREAIEQGLDVVDGFNLPQDSLFRAYQKADPESLSQLDALSEMVETSLSERGLSPLRIFDDVPVLGGSK